MTTGFFLKFCRAFPYILTKSQSRQPMYKILTLGTCFALFLASDTSSALPIPEIVAKAKRAVLKITAYDSKVKPLRFGTGFFISDDGRLVTNRHVIEDAKTIVAETGSGASYFCEGVAHPTPGFGLGRAQV
jgi:S1-C subfamily serine protease